MSALQSPRGREGENSYVYEVGVEMFRCIGYTLKQLIEGNIIQYYDQECQSYPMLDPFA